MSPFTNRTSRASPSGFVFPRRTVTSTPSPVASATSPQRRALTSLRRSPAMKSSPAITASSWPRFRATSSDSTPRPRRRGRRDAPGRGRGRRRSAGSPSAPGRCVPRPGSARRRDGPGSAPPPPPSTRSTGLSPARGARRGSRPGSRPRAAGRRARRRGGGGPRSTPGGCSG